MKIILENDVNNITQVYACCDKCEKPNRFYLGRADEEIQNVWDPKENAYCAKCGAKLDWENLKVKAYKEVKNYGDKIKEETAERILEYICLQYMVCLPDYDDVGYDELMKELKEHKIVN